MAPGAFSILAPFLRRKVKKYERLDQEDPEKKKQDATMEELTRINMKIDKLVTSMTKEDFEAPSSPEEECVGCRSSKAVMLVSPCSHQILCRLCFVKNIQQAVATRNLPLCCVLCGCKILRVKNNYRPTRTLPKSVSGYEVGRLRHSDSNYSVTSGLSVSSCGSTRSVRSNVSARSGVSASSWFSIDSLSSFQCASFDRNLPNPRAHSLTTRRSRRGSNQGPVEPSPGRPGAVIPNSQSTPALSTIEPVKPVETEPLPNSMPKSSSSVPENLSDYLTSTKPYPRLYRRSQGKENQNLRLKLISPDQAETSFTMSTIEEEIEGVNLSNNSQELISG